MKRNPGERRGCDRCKRDNGTYQYKHTGGNPVLLWFCVECVDELLEWPKKKEGT